MIPLTDILLALSVALPSAALGLRWLGYTTTARPSEPAGEFEVALLFDTGVLHHGTDLALAQLGLEVGENDWSDLCAKLQERFPNIPPLASPSPRGHVTLWATDRREPSRLRITWQGNLCRVTLGGFAEGKDWQVPPLDPDELASLRRASDTSPNPVWEVDRSGKVVWHNLAYQALYERQRNCLPRPDRPLFKPEPGHDRQRLLLGHRDTAPREWYEVTTVPLDGLTVHHATGITAIVEAEEARRNFVQTLGKTFAHLPIGLAIFDRDGRLALFNPALVDLTALRAEFLSARPTMLSFFDQLRENRHMPEPKNYLSWRENIARMISEANNGHYQETWTLESGQTYAMNGRPHPDGATAFLIEDISAEVALTRSFRAEMELGQSLFDTLEDAIAVFSATGTLRFCNARYRSLWKVDPDRTFAEVTIADSIATWRERTGPIPGWAEVEAIVLHAGPRMDREMPVQTRDGRGLICQTVPVATGATLVRFRTAPAPRPTPARAERDLPGHSSPLQPG